MRIFAQAARSLSQDLYWAKPVVPVFEYRVGLGKIGDFERRPRKDRVFVVDQPCRWPARRQACVECIDVVSRSVAYCLLASIKVRMKISTICRSSRNLSAFSHL